MVNPLISVVLSVYNAEKYLSEAIESILNQSYGNFEFIIINDGSTDRSLEIIKSYEDVRIILISRENRGLAASLNEGIIKATGKYIARMDADDISFPERFEKQITFMEDNHEIGICGTAVIMFGEHINNSLWRLARNDQAIRTELLFSSSLAHPTVMIRRALLIENELFYNEKFIHAEDIELWTRLEKYTKFANLKSPLLKYRVAENSISRKADKGFKERYRILKMVFQKYLEELEITNDEEENRLHFNLTLNTRQQNSNIAFNILNQYFSKITQANNTKRVFDGIELKKVLGKKWLWNLYYKREIKAIFSKHFFYGLLSLLSK